MSLKDLVRKAKKSNIADGLSGGAGNGRAFVDAIYNLPQTLPTEKEIIAELGNLSEEVKRYGLTDSVIKKLILSTYRLSMSQEARAVGCFHPSEISTETTLCHRKMYFQKGKVPYDATFVKFTSDNRMQRLVDLGTLVHLYIQENLQRLGILKDFETPVFAPDFGIQGKTDGIVEFEGLDDLNNFYLPEDMILEIKTINDYGFKALRKPKPEHIKQASIYGHFLGMKKICFVYYNKNTSDLKIYVADVDNDYVENFKKLAGELIKLFNSNVRKHRTSDVSFHTNIPKRICKNRSTERAMNCAYSDFCFNLND